jgi:glycosyltransferase involved in cell wall biosynthesis
MIAAVHDPRSLGVHRYVERLAGALAELAIDYRPVSRPCRGTTSHFHLANSTRAVVAHAARQRQPFLLTVHDVVPRAAVLRPAHRAVVVPLCVSRASLVVVHSRHAAELLMRTSAVPARRVVIVAFPATRPRSDDRSAARTALRLEPDGPPLFVLPGVLKAAKLVAETLRAATPLLASGRARLLLAGHVVDERVVSAAEAAGAVVLRDPPGAAYEHAIVAADAVLCMRAASVGETNAPLLDAIGAGRASLVTAVGSAPEVAGDSARVVAASVAGIRRGLEALLDEGERGARAAAACQRARQLTWSAAARRHAELLAEVGGG